MRLFLSTSIDKKRLRELFKDNLTWKHYLRTLETHLEHTVGEFKRETSFTIELKGIRWECISTGPKTVVINLKD